MNATQLKRSVEAARGCLAHMRTTSSYRRYPADDPERKDNDWLGATDPFLEDERRILCSKAFRRLARKTQVVSYPRNQYIRDRLVHTGEVAATTMMIADILGLNVNLASAIAFGHDIGHVPFGHQGEVFMMRRFGKPFTHEVMGVVVAQHVERKGFGLNLTHATLDGMLRHSGKNVTSTMTPEARANRYGDKIAYLYADYNDFERMGFPMSSELVGLVNSFGSCQRERVFTTVASLVLESKEKGRVDFSESAAALRFDRIRTLMYEIYPRITNQDPTSALEPICRFLDGLRIARTDLALALMTDVDIVHLVDEPMLNLSHIRETALGELIPTLQSKRIDPYDPDLDWSETERVKVACPCAA